MLFSKEKFAKKIEETLGQNGLGLSPSSLSGFSGIDALPTSPAQAGQSLENDLKDATNTPDENGLTVMGHAPSKKDELDIGREPSAELLMENQVAEAMKENLDYGESDLSKKTKQNSLELLPNR